MNKRRLTNLKRRANKPKYVLNRLVKDWKTNEAPEMMEPGDDKTYRLTAEASSSGNQVYIEVSDASKPATETELGLSVVVEINNGKPTLHIGTEIWGDHLLHVVAVDEKLIITQDGNLERAPKSRYTYEDVNSYELFNDPIPA
jgi:hypothetical protein